MMHSIPKKMFRIYDPLWGYPQVTDELSSQRDSNTESASMSWNYHVDLEEMRYQSKTPAPGGK